MSKLVLKKYNDPGHGWVAVKRKLIVQLGIADKISGWSYQKGQTVYLEEDGDMDLLLEALRVRKIEYETKVIYCKGHSKIRGYESYRPSEVIGVMIGG